MRLLSLALIALAAFSAVGDFTSWPEREVDLGAAAFPAPVIERFAVPASAELNREIAKVLKDAVDVIRLKPTSWFATAVPEQKVTTAEIERVLKGAPGIPVRICKSECRPCDNRPACLAAKDIGQEVGTMIFIRECALSRGGCKHQNSALVLREFVEQSLGLFAYYKIVGTKNRDKAEKNSRKAAVLIRETASSVNGILSRCPGPYTGADTKFLTSAGHLSPPGDFARKCGNRYEEVLRKIAPKCSNPKMKIREVLRCDEFCQAMLCMKAGKAPQIRNVSGRKALLLRPASCEGGEPTALEEFLKQNSAERVKGCSSVK